MPCGGTKKSVQIPHPWTTPKLHFSVNKLQMPYLQEICNNLIKMHDTPFANHSQPLGYIYCKKDHINLLNINVTTPDGLDSNSLPLPFRTPARQATLFAVLDFDRSL